MCMYVRVCNVNVYYIYTLSLFIYDIQYMSAVNSVYNSVIGKTCPYRNRK